MMLTDEPFIKMKTTLPQFFGGEIYFHPTLPQHLHALATDTAERIDATDYAAFQSAFHDEGCAGRCLAIVGTRFQTDIYRALGQKRPILLLHSVEGIDLSVAFTGANVIALAQNATVGTYHHGTHHRVGGA